MKNIKLVLLTSTICLFVALPFTFFGLTAPYVEAGEDSDIPNVTEIIFDFNSEEIKNVYDLNLVTVIINGSPQKVLTNRIGINRLLEDLGVVVNNNKKIISTTDTVQTGTVIRVITIGTVIEEENIEIPFRTEEISSTEIPYGEKEVVEEGVLGLRTKEVKRTYEDGVLVSEETLSEQITREPTNRIIKVGVLRFTPEDLDVQYGYNCDHWYKVVDQGNYTDEEKDWLKFVMECESGCNGESDKSYYKGLFQWSPYYWYKQYPNENIYDGYAQIKHTVEKIRSGAHSMWPGCNKQYENTR
jgi:hypothetical protein